MSKKHIHRRKSKIEAKNRFHIIFGRASHRKSFLVMDEAHLYLENIRNK